MNWGRNIPSSTFPLAVSKPDQHFPLQHYTAEQQQQVESGILREMRSALSNARPASTNSTSFQDMSLINSNFQIEGQFSTASNTNFFWPQSNVSDVLQKIRSDVMDNANNSLDFDKQNTSKEAISKLPKPPANENSGSHQCKVCGMFLLSEDILTLHMKLHTNFSLGESSKCVNKQSSQIPQENSTKTNSCEKKYPCTICGKGLSTKVALNHHMKRHTGVGLYKCGECKKSFTEKRSLDRHIMFVHRGKKPFQCIECGKLFDRASYLRAHLDLHGKINSGGRQQLYKCRKCSKAFLDEKDLSVHVRRHAGKKRFQCDKCDKSFKFKSAVNRHLSCHTKEKPYKCQVCGKFFKTKSFVKFHMKMHTGEKPYSCIVCKKTFALAGTLRYHMTIHSDSKPFQCSLCDKAFVTKRYLTRHLAVHSGERPYICGKCGQCFKLQDALVQHMTIHSKDAPFMCLDCGKCFQKQIYLNRHIKKFHTTIFKCPHCLVVCGKKEELAAHVKIHLANQVWRCEKCNVSFDNEMMLHFHNIRTPHENKETLQPQPAYRCKYCGESFTEQESVRVHCLLQHKEALY